MDRLGGQRPSPGSGSVRPVYAGAVLGSLAVGALWSWHYGLGGAGFAVLALVHAGIGLALGAFLGWAAPRTRHAFVTGFAASLALAGAAPALASLLVPSSPESADGRDLAHVERRD